MSQQGRIQDFGLEGALAGGLRDGSPPAGVWGQCPQKPEECYVMRLKKTTYRNKKKQVHTDYITIS